MADLVVAVAAIGLSPYVKGEGLNATLPGFWVMGVVLAWAILWRWPGGLAAAVVVSVADLGIRDDITQKTYGNIFLLILGGAIVGFLSGPAPADGRASATGPSAPRPPRPSASGWPAWCTTVCSRCWRWCSAAAPELGPDGRELGRLAGEQEVRLRALVQQDSRDLVAAAGRPDLGALLAELQSAHVHVAVPGTPGDAAGRAAPARWSPRCESCLSNVRHHVGRDAEAWVLLEELDDRWVVSVRDDGPGIPEGRLEESAAEGRLGRAAVDRRPDARPRRHGDGALGAGAGHRVGAATVPR